MVLTTVLVMYMSYFLDEIKKKHLYKKSQPVHCEVKYNITAVTDTHADNRLIFAVTLVNLKRKKILETLDLSNY